MAHDVGQRLSSSLCDRLRVHKVKCGAGNRNPTRQYDAALGHRLPHERGKSDRRIWCALQLQCARFVLGQAFPKGFETGASQRLCEMSESSDYGRMVLVDYRCRI